VGSWSEKPVNLFGKTSVACLGGFVEGDGFVWMGWMVHDGCAGRDVCGADTRLGSH